MASLATSKFLPFPEALVVARSRGLASQKEWEVWCKNGMRPLNLPRSPQQIYKDHGWQGWGHWLGTGNIQNGDQQFLPFAEALAVARCLGLASVKEWKAWCKEGLRPRHVPAKPEHVYADHGWQGWGHWLGTGNQATKQFLPFGEALAVARSLGLASQKEWWAWCKDGMRPRNMPANPDKVYKDHGWQGMVHWLGTGSQRPRATHFLEFGEALRVARALRLNTSREWHAWCRSGARPANVPANPHRFYVHDGWLGWEQWLCHESTAPGCGAHAAQLHSSMQEQSPQPGLPQHARRSRGCTTAAGTAGGTGRKRQRRQTHGPCPVPRAGAGGVPEDRP